MTDSKEVWENITGYEGLYQISNLGRVKSLERINYQNKHQDEIIMKKYLGNKGYFTVKLTKNGKTQIFTIHRLVATTFIPNPNNLPCVNHKDENRQNNEVSNLEWCSYHYNNNYGNRNKKIAKRLGMTIVSIDKNGNKKIYTSISEAARKLGVNGIGNISKVLSGNSKTAYGYKWEIITKLAGEKYD